MQLALRPYVTTGIALVGASVIAISPINPVTPDIHVPSISTSSMAVQLTGAVNPIGDPISAWLNTAVNAVEGAVGIGGQVLGNGAPVLTQILANQRGYLNLIGTAFKQAITNISTWPGDTQWLRDYAGVMFKEGQIGEAWNWGVVYPISSLLTALFPLIDLLTIPG